MPRQQNPTPTGQCDRPERQGAREGGRNDLPANANSAAAHDNHHASALPALDTDQERQGPDTIPPTDAAESAPPAPRPRRRARRRELRCPVHPTLKLFSVSAKHHIYLTDRGALMLRGLSKRRADAVMQAYRQVLPLTDEWIEGFWCEGCNGTNWWHVRRHDRHEYSLSRVPAELWEQASGVIRPEGNPSVSQYTRRQARANGVLGQRQYRFL